MKTANDPVVTVEQIANTLRKVFIGRRPGDAEWSRADDDALNFALAGWPNAHDALLDWTQRAMEAEAKLRYHNSVELLPPSADHPAQRFADWRVVVSEAAEAAGMSVEVTDDHFDWFKARFDEGCSPSDAIKQAKKDALS